MPQAMKPQKLRFWDIFATQSGYEELDERKQLTAKMEVAVSLGAS